MQRRPGNKTKFLPQLKRQLLELAAWMTAWSAYRLHKFGRHFGRSVAGLFILVMFYPILEYKMQEPGRLACFETAEKTGFLPESCGKLRWTKSERIAVIFAASNGLPEYPRELTERDFRTLEPVRLAQETK